MLTEISRTGYYNPLISATVTVSAKLEMLIDNTNNPSFHFLMLLFNVELLGKKPDRLYKR